MYDGTTTNGDSAKTWTTVIEVTANSRTVSFTDDDPATEFQEVEMTWEEFDDAVGDARGLRKSFNGSTEDMYVYGRRLHVKVAA